MVFPSTYSAANFIDELAAADSKVFIVEFSSEASITSVLISKQLQQLCDNNKEDLCVRNVNIDMLPRLAKLYGVNDKTVTTYAFFLDGKLASTYSQTNQSNFESLVKEMIRRSQRIQLNKYHKRT